MAKYKVGDKVRIVSERPESPRFVDSMVQYLGKTLTVSKVEEETFEAIYRFKEATYPAYVRPIASLLCYNASGMWAFAEGWIAGLAEPKKPEFSVSVHFHGLLTVAELVKDGKVVKVENARCNPKDKYSMAEGARIAVERLFQEKATNKHSEARRINLGDKFVVTGNSYRPLHCFSNGTIVTAVAFRDSGTFFCKSDDGFSQCISPFDLKPCKENTK